jgi:uncharacterized protein YhfF
MAPLASTPDVLAKLAARGVVLPGGRVTVGSYGDSPALSQALIELIRGGPKRAGTGLLWAHEFDQEALPQPGDIEVVVDHENEPVLVTRIVTVETVPFGRVTADYARIEGEGDGSLEYWRTGHWAFFARECARIGRSPSEDMPVVCSTFELVQVIPAPGAA